MGNIAMWLARVPLSADARVEHAFLVMENDEADNDHRDTIVAMPSRAWLTPLSIMVCDTI